MTDSREPVASEMEIWRYIFSGAVSSPGGYLHFEQPFSGKFAHVAAGLEGDWVLQIAGSQILMTFESLTKIEDYYTLRNVLQSLASECCDALNLVHGTTFEVHLVSIYACREKQSHAFHIGVSDISLHEQAPVMTVSGVRHADHLFVAAVDRPFANALADFRSALKYLAQSGFHCRRAFEALAHSFGPMGEDSKDRLKSIRALQTALNLDDSCGRALLEASGNARHGGSPWVTGKSRVKWLRLTQTIILRHAEYILAVKIRNAEPPKFGLLRFED